MDGIKTNNNQNDSSRSFLQLVVKEDDVLFRLAKYLTERRKTSSVLRQALSYYVLTETDEVINDFLDSLSEPEKFEFLISLKASLDKTILKLRDISSELADLKETILNLDTFIRNQKFVNEIPTVDVSDKENDEDDIVSLQNDLLNLFDTF